MANCEFYISFKAVVVYFFVVFKIFVYNTDKWETKPIYIDLYKYLRFYFDSIC